MSANPDQKMQTIRAEILEGMLANVVFDGWNRRALDAGARDAGYDDIMAGRAFPRGLPEVAALWSEQSDARMLEALDTLDWENMRIRDRIAAGVKARIMVNMDNREALRRCVAWLALPLNAGLGMKSALRTVNEMWYAAGDQSTDWNYYSKRGLLLPVYTTTVLYWLADTPDEAGDYPDTWGYLDRRIDDVLKTFGMPKRVGEKLKQGFMASKRAKA
jgi:ubiquinone biosynthesis protein COQ9